jgi:hypothetical protein
MARRRSCAVSNHEARNHQGLVLRDAAKTPHPGDEGIERPTTQPDYGDRTGSVMRFMARASCASSQRMSLVADIASTKAEEDTPILVR